MDETWTTIAPGHSMSKTARYIALGLSCTIVLAAALWATVNSSEAKRKSEHLRLTHFCLTAIAHGFKLNPVNYHWSLKNEAKFGNSWRLYFTLTYPYDDADAERGDGNQPWRSEALSHWDDDVHFLFTVHKAREFPRPSRYANIMAIRGAGTAFEYAAEHRIDDLREAAHDAVLLTEVANSNISWMQAGDLELDKLPHEIDPANKRGIGSSLGYDQFGVAFADGEVWFLESTVPFDELTKFLTVDSARRHDRLEDLGKYRVPYTDPQRN